MQKLGFIICLYRKGSRTRFGIVSRKRNSLLKPLKNEKRRNLMKRIIATLIVIVMSLMVVSCGNPSSSMGGNGGEINSNQGNSQGNNNQSNIQGNGNEMPDYFSDLIILDEVFKQYSYNGIDEDIMAEAILKAYPEYSVSFFGGAAQPVRRFHRSSQSGMRSGNRFSRTNNPS